MVLETGARLGPYVVVSPLGAGGMGEVYRAHDPRLGREVAIKVLPAEVAADPDRLRRFALEARAASALNQVNILTVHDLGEQDGVGYLVTELLEGATLRERLAAGEGSAAIPVLDWATQIARGLAAAHDKGIVHRDLKPENLFACADGRIKILDFGLAAMTGGRWESPSSATTASIGVTAAGALLGTLGYMAPEQLRGETVDPRADVFAFGCVLDELLSGRRAFRRPSPAETIAATLGEEPPPVARAISGGAGLDPLLVRCLAKRREERFGSARELLAELEAVALGAGREKGRPRAARRRGGLDSLAVLPFVNEAADPDLEYLAEGIAESALDALTALPRLRVLARSTVMRYRERAAEPIEVGRELGVRAVLTGRLRQRGDLLRIDCELVRVDDGARLWGHQYERTLDTLPRLGDELAEEIAAQLRGRLSGGERRRLGRRAAPSSAAYQEYLKGRYFWNRWTAEAMRTSIRHYDRAIELDPLYALAWAGIADSWAALGQTKAVAPGEAFPKAKAAALRALEADADLAEAHASLGFVQRFWEWDWQGSERSFRRALALAPGYATAHRWFGYLCSGLARHDEAIAEVRLALDLDPLSLIIHTALGDVLFYARRYGEAIDYYRRALEMDSGFLAGHSDLARALEFSRRTEEALAEYEQAIRLAGKSMADPSAGLANVLAVAGRREESLGVLAQLERERADRYVSPWALASIHARLGQSAAALDWLERAEQERDSTLVWLRVHPRFDELRGEPRFQALAARLRLDEGGAPAASGAPTAQPS